MLRLICYIRTLFTAPKATKKSHKRQPTIFTKAHDLLISLVLNTNKNHFGDFHNDGFFQKSFIKRATGWNFFAMAISCGGRYFKVLSRLE